MKKLTPIIKFNGGNAVALCNRCYIIMCFVSCNEGDQDCVVEEINGNDEGPYISETLLGKTPPIYCEKCKQLLTYSVNE